MTSYRTVHSLLIFRASTNEQDLFVGTADPCSGALRRHINEDEAWKRELFLRPGEWILWVTVAVVTETIIVLF